MWRRRTAPSLLLLALALHSASAQQLGYKLLGSAGIDAGVQPPAGLTVIDQTLHYGADELRDRNGSVVPIDGLDISATGSALGVSYTHKAKRTPYFTFAIGAPVARIRVSSDNPAASLNGFGFADMFLEPIKVGWRERRFDVVSGYAVYAPTGHFEPRSGSGTGTGYWTHQLSIGGAVYADSTRGGRASALVSYQLNSRKRGIDIRRGDMLQVQGGAGTTVAKIFTAGVAGYALWQVTPDRGADIPPALRGERSQVFGVGPELGATIPRFRAHVSLRVEREFGVESRPKGQVITLGLFWRP